MGGESGDRVDPLIFPSEEESSHEQEFLEQSLGLPSSLSAKVDDGSVNEEDGLVFRQYCDMGRQISSDSLEFESKQRRMLNVYGEVLRSYDDLKCGSESLEEAKAKILSYTPGSWIEKAGGMNISDFDVPKTTSLLLIGPKGSGKSSLINKISRMFENDKFSSERAQVSYNSSERDGTYFLSEYTIPRSSSSFCLYDTRGFNDSSENMEMLRVWMTEGVRHGELIIRNSDSSCLKTRMKFKARENDRDPGVVRKVNFVIFVVNGLSVLKAMDNEDGVNSRFAQTIAANFDCPYLSFKDDKPVVVVTHGDLLLLSDRTRARVWLGELLGIHPKKQIFDIPESCDLIAEFSIVEMLRYCLEHADRNLPVKKRLMGKVGPWSLRVCLFILAILGIVMISVHIHGGFSHRRRRHRHLELDIDIDWRKIRHLWL